VGIPYRGRDLFPDRDSARLGDMAGILVAGLPAPPGTDIDRMIREEGEHARKAFPDIDFDHLAA
jgi:hypothetical protein